LASRRLGKESRGANGTRLPPGAAALFPLSVDFPRELDPLLLYLLVEHARTQLATQQLATLQIAYKPSIGEWPVTSTGLWRFIDEPAG
jgi:hypothetical protein